MTSSELDGLLALWRRLRRRARRGGRYPAERRALGDVEALLRYAATHGFLLAASLGLARSATSGGALRKRLGLSQYTEAAFIEKLCASGYAADRLPKDMEHNLARMTFRARPV